VLVFYKLTPVRLKQHKVALILDIDNWLVQCYSLFILGFEKKYDIVNCCYFSC